MTFNGWFQIALYCVIVAVLTRPFGGYMTRVFSGERTLLSPVLHPVERGIYWLCGTDEKVRPPTWSSFHPSNGSRSRPSSEAKLATSMSPAKSMRGGGAALLFVAGGTATFAWPFTDTVPSVTVSVT